MTDAKPRPRPGEQVFIPFEEMTDGDWLTWQLQQRPEPTNSPPAGLFDQRPDPNSFPMP